MSAAEHLLMWKLLVDMFRHAHGTQHQTAQNAVERPNSTEQEIPLYSKHNGYSDDLGTSGEGIAIIL